MHFTQYGIRAEERMNFSIAIEMQFAIGDTLKAVSSDLSVSGIKVKVPSARKFVKGQKIAIYLTGLEQEFELGLKDGIQYEVVGIDKINIANNYIRMKRTFTEDIAAFDDFLGNFINGNKRRYKVNLDNTLEAVAVKGYEQYYLPRVTTLPVYIRQINDRLLPTLALATENNRSTLGYFSDESKNLVFQQILDMPRLENMLLSDRGIKESLLYCFTHARKGKVYFYSATTEELDASPELRSTFLHFASKKTVGKFSNYS
ncbi:PilZ domain-containing protein [Psychrosphaera algicola]|uniref:PilZ domain-containing protein n=1 Tax=Psychrosphaera algicola TaxID=3023714 RepID=A0ABT5F9P8_9GAMM|nr:PilZ domain-containing protein [Psychrosphaera sp. G1-22]MDC2888250.1 PilZ domain-containing protein [Psychrosphaera sp. G1-22]